MSPVHGRRRGKFFRSFIHPSTCSYLLGWAILISSALRIQVVAMNQTHIIVVLGALSPRSENEELNPLTGNHVKKTKIFQKGVKVSSYLLPVVA
jgi:hypothetical protein